MGSSLDSTINADSNCIKRFQNDWNTDIYAQYDDYENIIYYLKKTKKIWCKSFIYYIRR